MGVSFFRLQALQLPNSAIFLGCRATNFFVSTKAADLQAVPARSADSVMFAEYWSLARSVSVGVVAGLAAGLGFAASENI